MRYEKDTRYVSQRKYNAATYMTQQLLLWFLRLLLKLQVQVK
jgi:hypothetical protein